MWKANDRDEAVNIQRSDTVLPWASFQTIYATAIASRYNAMNRRNQDILGDFTSRNTFS